MLVSRRELLYGMATAFAGFAMPRLAATEEAPSGLRINAARLKRRLEDLSVYGRPEGGTFADRVGNIFGARAGMAASAPRILFGSHIDSVPNGGNFDGDVGSMSAIEVMQTFEENHVTTKHPSKWSSGRTKKIWSAVPRRPAGWTRASSAASTTVFGWKTAFERLGVIQHG